MLAVVALIPAAAASAGNQLQGNHLQGNRLPAPQHQAVPPPAIPPPLDAYQSYRAMLLKMCPLKHLELLSPGELDDLIEVNFHDALPGALQTRLDAADTAEKAACAHATMGLACFNIAYIRAMDDVKLLPRFTRMACDSGIVCRAPAECDRPH
jgi:hypothetical protein